MRGRGSLRGDARPRALLASPRPSCGRPMRALRAHHLPGLRHPLPGSYPLRAMRGPRAGRPGAGDRGGPQTQQGRAPRPGTPARCRRRHLPPVASFGNADRPPVGVELRPGRLGRSRVCLPRWGNPAPAVVGVTALVPSSSGGREHGPFHHLGGCRVGDPGPGTPVLLRDRRPLPGPWRNLGSGPVGGVSPAKTGASLTEGGG